MKEMEEKRLMLSRKVIIGFFIKSICLLTGYWNTHERLESFSPEVVLFYLNHLLLFAELSLSEVNMDFLVIDYSCKVQILNALK